MANREDTAPVPAVPEPVEKCDHICLKDAGHVERGEPHFYGYEIPSPRRDFSETPAPMRATTATCDEHATGLLGHPLDCTLPIGHGGMHRGVDGVEWHLRDTAPVPALIAALKHVAYSDRIRTRGLRCDHADSVHDFADRLGAVSSEPGWVAVNTATGEVRRMEPRTVVGAYTPFPHNGCTFTAWRIEEPTDGP